MGGREGGGGGGCCRMTAFFNGYNRSDLLVKVTFPVLIYFDGVDVLRWVFLIHFMERRKRERRLDCAVVSQDAFLSL